MACLEIIFALLVVGRVLCEETCSSKENAEENLKKLGFANNYLAVNLHRKLSSLSDENLFFSPFTLSTVLTMLYAGARGETAQELRKLLGFQRSKLDDSAIFATTHHYLTEALAKADPGSYIVHCASALIVDRSFPLRSDYKSRIRELYQAYIEDADLEGDNIMVIEKLNTWVKKHTRGTIKKLVEAIDPATVLLLVSAAYFRGSWRVKFDPKDSTYQQFYNRGSFTDKSEVLMMHATATYRYYEEEGEFAAIELAYEGKNVSMVIFLPAEVGGLPYIEEEMTPSKLAYVRRQMYYTKVHLTLPKFKLGYNRDLSKELQDLGVRKAFSPSADFTGMTVGKSAPILDEVKHKAMIEVNEKGSIAAAISSVIMTKMIPTSDAVPVFYADHPFLFVIVDSRSGLILFMGRINKL